jgi:hypothetical protein
MNATENMSNTIELDSLPGTRKEDSIINEVYRNLAKGRVLTTLDAVKSNRTVCLGKYISLLRNKYQIAIKDKWIELENQKRIKQYWLAK